MHSVTTTDLKPNMISSCRKWASSSIDRMASVSTASQGRKRLFKLFFSVRTTWSHKTRFWLAIFLSLTLHTEQCAQPLEIVGHLIQVKPFSIWATFWSSLPPRSYQVPHFFKVMNHKILDMVLDTKHTGKWINATIKILNTIASRYTFTHKLFISLDDVCHIQYL